MSNARQRGAAWCFTLNNFTSEEEEALKVLAGSADIRYMVFGRETGEGGTPHLQGYVEFSRKKSFSVVRGINSRAHWERRRGSSKQASDYCKKDGNFFEEGSRSAPGKRSDLALIKKLIEDGADEHEIASQYFNQWVVYRRSFSVYRELVNQRRSFKSWTNLIWGETGTGKTRLVHFLHKEDPIFIWGGDRWFDGYEGQAIALLDDYNGELEITLLLKLLDRYPLQVPIKGGFKQWYPRKIYITSNHTYTDWYPKARARHLEALARRLDRIDYLNTNIFEN